MGIRTFIAIPLDEEMVDEISRVSGVLKGRITGAKWVEPQNLHITLRFLGDVEEGDMGKVLRAAEKAAMGSRPVEISLGKVGAFPGERNARVLWVGLSSGGDELGLISRRLNEELSKGGFGPPDKDFSPHITIARLRKPANISGAIAGLDVRGIRSVVGELVVMRSDLRSTGPVYTPIERFGLRGKEGDYGWDSRGEEEGGRARHSPDREDIWEGEHKQAWRKRDSDRG
jgi:2'-5' RNA ligase